MRPIYDYSVLYHLGAIESAFPRNKGVKAALNMVKNVINNAPTVSQGEGMWTNRRTIEHDGEYWCTACGKEITIYMGEDRKDRYAYCPNCGAKMQEPPKEATP